MPLFSREQLQEARLQARAKRQEEIDNKHADIERARNAGDDTEELERELKKLYDDFNERRMQRREAKLAARALRDSIAEGIGKRPAIRWNTSEEGHAARDSVKKIRKADMKFALQPGQMVKLITKARVAHEGQWVYETTLPKGSIGILIDPPHSLLSAVMFGADVWRVPTKKLRAADVDE
jgi:hypothetical protein